MLVYVLVSCLLPDDSVTPCDYLKQTVVIDNSNFINKNVPSLKLNSSPFILENLSSLLFLKS